MLKKIWKYFFGPVEFQVDQNGLQYGQKESVYFEPELIEKSIVKETPTTIRLCENKTQEMTQ